MGWRDDLWLEWETNEYRRLVADHQVAATPTLATNIARIYQANPYLDPEVSVSLALGGADETTAFEVGQEAINQMIRDGGGRDADKRRNDPDVDDDDNKSWFESFGDAFMTGVKATTRSAFLVFDSAAEVVNGTLGLVLGTPGVNQRIENNGVIPGLLDYITDIPKQTSLWEAGSQFRENGRIDLGTGFFVGGQVDTNQAARQRAMLGTVQNDGQTYAWTPGRGFAEAMADVGLIQEGSWGWNVASGVLDATVALVADPSNLIPGIGWGDELIQGVKNVGSRRLNQYVDLVQRADVAQRAGDTAEMLRLRQAALGKLGARNLDNVGRQLNPLEASIRDSLMDQIGMSPDNIAAVDTAAFMSYLTKKSGTRLVSRMVEETSPAVIAELHKGKIGPALATELADATNANEVVAAYVKALANPAQDLSNMLRAVPSMGLFHAADLGMWVRRNVNSRVKLGRMMPESPVLDPTRPTEYAQRANALFNVIPTNSIITDRKATRYDQILKQNMMDKVYRALASGDQTQIYELNNELAGTFEKVFRNLGYTREQASAWTKWADEANEYMRFEMNAIASGENMGNIPLLPTQLLSSGAAIVDPAQMDRLIRHAGDIRRFLRTKVGAGRSYAKKLVQLEDAERDLELARAGGNVDEINTASRRATTIERELAGMKVGEDNVVLRAMNGAELAADFLIGQVWKPLQLIRGAFIARVVGEETLRTVNSGTFGGRGRMLDYFRASFGGGYGTDALGRRFRVAVDEFAEADSRRLDILDDLEEARRAGNQTEVDELMRQLAEVDGRIDGLMDEVNEAQEFFHRATLSNNNMDSMAALTKNPKKIMYQSGQARNVDRTNPKETADWVAGMVDRVLKFNNDPVMRPFARQYFAPDAVLTVNGVSREVAEHLAADPSLTFDKLFAFYLKENKGREHLEKVARAYRASGAEFNPDSIDDILLYVRRLQDELAYVAGGTVDPLTRSVVGANDGIIEAISSGSFQGQRIQQLNKKARTTQIDAGFRRHVEEFAAADNAPKMIESLGDSIYGEDKVGLMDRIAGWFFTQAYGQASDKLARSPVFRRAYWKQMSMLVDRASAEDAAKLLEKARGAGLSKKLLKDIEKRASIARGDASVEALDGLAKGAALSITRDLLFDASKRGATFDQLRLVMPFGDAWKEVMQTWGRLFIRQRGMNLYRMLRNAEALMGADAGPLGAGDMYGYDPATGEFTPGLDGQREGFVYTNPTAKDKRVMIPFSRQISQAIMNVSGMDSPGVGFGIPVKNMSIAGGILPGIGPFADRAVETIIPEDPEFTWLRDLIFPFGAPAQTAEGEAVGVEEQFLPPWLRRLSAAVPKDFPIGGWIAGMIYDKQNDPSYQATVGHMYSQLMSTGRYDMSFEGQQQAQRDAVRAADRMTAFRGLLQGFAPGAPLPEYMAETEGGDVMAALLVDQLRDLEQKFIDNGGTKEQALSMMMDTYGPDVWLYAAPNSTSAMRGVEATQEWYEWYLQNDGVVSQYGLIAPFLGPTGGEFDVSTYGDMQRTGIYEIASPDQKYNMAARALGFLAYNRLRDQLPPEQFRSNYDKLMLSRLRSDIEDFFNIDLESAERRSEREQQINQAESLMRAADQGQDDAVGLLNTPTGQSMRIYLEARQRVIEMSRELGVRTWQQAKGGAPFRDFLRSLGKNLSLEDEGFAKMYQFVFDGEMLDDLEVQVS